LKIISIQI